MYSYLNDYDFLKEVAAEKVEEFFIKITLLDWNENPILDILGKTISANINIDGNSAVRRTATLSLIADLEINNITNTNNLLSINKKVKMSIGYYNVTDSYTEYDMLWFPLGIYVINSSSISHSSDGLVISLSLLDKMCLLNGDCGGILPASTVFDNYETIDENGDTVIERPTIYLIIRELVNHWGGELLGKIIISDLDTRVKLVMKWTNTTPLYFLTKDGLFYMTTNAEDYITKREEGWSDYGGSPFEYGDDVGYILTDFSYPGDLIGDAGTAITSVLDTIKNTLGNFEYFYDINGNFIFLEIKNYLNNTEVSSILKNMQDKLYANMLPPDYIGLNYDGDGYLFNVTGGKAEFNFENSELISSYSNNPSYAAIKNDFVVWGIRKVKSGDKEKEYPIRYHLAFDKKPTPGNTYKAFSYVDPNDNILKWHIPLDYSGKTLPTKGVVGLFYYDGSKIYKWAKTNDIYSYEVIDSSLVEITTTDWRTELYFLGVMTETTGVSSNYYYAELLNEWPKLYNIVEDELDEDSGEYLLDNNNLRINNSGFKEEVLSNLTLIDYYLDFIDSDSQISLFSIDGIGRRTEVLNEESSVNCIFEPNIPDVVLIPTTNSTDSKTETGKLRDECDARGLTYYQVPDTIYSNLIIGGTFNSAYLTIRQLIHQYTSYMESVSISAMPLYFLEPNVRISILDPDSNIYGDYMVNSLSYTLGINSVLTINATRAVEKI